MKTFTHRPSPIALYALLTALLLAACGSNPTATSTPWPMSTQSTPATATPSPLPLFTASPLPPAAQPPLLPLTFGVENAQQLYPLLGDANPFGQTRITADERSFAEDGTLRHDFQEFSGLREYVIKALQSGQAAIVVDVQVGDSPQRVANKVRSLLALAPQSPPWLLIIGNELNLKRPDAYPVETYYAQFRAAYAAAKAFSPTIQLSLDGENGWDGVNSPEPGLRVEATAHLRQVLDRCQRDAFAPDYLTIHVYDSLFAPGKTGSVRSLERRVQAMQVLLDGYTLPSRPKLYVGEYGLPVVQSLPIMQQFRWERLLFTEPEQTNIVFMAAAWSMAHGIPLNYYAAVDTPPALRRPDTGEGAYGLVASDGRKRPAFEALRRAHSLPTQTVKGQLLEDGSNGVGAVQFELSNGRTLYVAQATTQAAIEWKIPSAAGHSLRVEDVSGQGIDNALIPRADGITFVKLPAASASRAGGPVRLIVIE